MHKDLADAPERAIARTTLNNKQGGAKAMALQSPAAHPQATPPAFEEQGSPAIQPATWSPATTAPRSSCSDEGALGRAHSHSRPSREGVARRHAACSRRALFFSRSPQRQTRIARAHSWMRHLEIAPLRAAAVAIERGCVVSLTADMAPPLPPTHQPTTKKQKTKQRAT